MLMLAESVKQAHLMLQEIERLANAEEHIQALSTAQELQRLLEQIFTNSAHIDIDITTQIQNLSSRFTELLPQLKRQQTQIKNSITEMAALKSDNKISKTYQID